MIRVEECSIQAIIDANVERGIIYHHHEEIERGKPHFQPDYDWYLAREEEGQLTVIGAFDEKILIGYCIDILVENPHYNNALFATNDALYLLPPYRHLGIAKELISAAIASHRDVGVAHYTVSLKADNHCSHLMQELELQRTEVAYSIDLRGKG